MWAPNDERLIIGSFTDGIFPGEVIEDIGDTVRADFLVPATLLKLEKGEVIGSNHHLINARIIFYIEIQFCQYIQL